MKAVHAGVLRPPSKRWCINNIQVWTTPPPCAAIGAEPLSIGWSNFFCRRCNQWAGVIVVGPTFQNSKNDVRRIHVDSVYLIGVLKNAFFGVYRAFMVVIRTAFTKAFVISSLFSSEWYQWCKSFRLDQRNRIVECEFVATQNNQSHNFYSFWFENILLVGINERMAAGANHRAFDLYVCAFEKPAFRDSESSRSPGKMRFFHSIQNPDFWISYPSVQPFLPMKSRRRRIENWNRGKYPDALERFNTRRLIWFCKGSSQFLFSSKQTQVLVNSVFTNRK